MRVNGNIDPGGHWPCTSQFPNFDSLIIIAKSFQTQTCNQLIDQWQSKIKIKIRQYCVTSFIKHATIK